MTGSLEEYYHWEETGRGVRIYMHAGMADRLQAEMLASEKEVGGILLGRTEEDRGKTSVFIESFVPVQSSYPDAPRYSLSGEDTVALEGVLLRAALAGCQSPDAPAILGYYRSHTRDGLSLAAADLDVIDSYFQSPSSIFLLIKAAAGSRACTAGFFFWEDGRIQSEFSALEVALGRLADRETAVHSPQLTAAPAEVSLETWDDEMPEDLTKLFAHPPAAQPEPVKPAAKQPVVAAVEPSALKAEQPAQLDKTRQPWPSVLWRVATICFATAALVISVMTYLGSRPAREEAVPSRPIATALGLRVERNPPDLLVSWDPNTREVAAARRATLFIRDGNTEKLFNLNRADLARGSHLYTPSSDYIQFRLEVFGEDGGSVAQSVRVAGPPR